MAGIGFELQRILARQTYSSTLQAYSYAALIGSGPWLVSVLSLGFLGTLLTAVLDPAELRLFFVTISFVYSVTLVLTGPVQMVVTRLTADIEYRKESSKIFPTFATSLGWTAVIFLVLGAVIFGAFVPGERVYRSAATWLMVLVACIWIAGIFLSALKSYRAILGCFIIGFAASVLLAIFGEKRGGVSGAMVGFAAGQAILLASLCFVLVRGLGNSGETMPAGEILQGFTKYRYLALGGLFYNLGIWIDKYMFWWMDPAADQIAGILYSSPVYDRVVYFGFLSIVPGMAVFLLKLETDFARSTTTFFQMVLRKGTLNQIEEAREAIVSALRDGFLLLLKVQAIVTAFLLVARKEHFEFLKLGAIQTGVFEVILVGLFLLVLLLAFLTVLYYLDRQKEALICCVIFTVVNALCTWWTIQAGERWFGAGFLVASGVAVMVGVHYVNRSIEELEFRTFTSQPVYGGTKISE
jgi:uncharacterized membrane protein